MENLAKIVITEIALEGPHGIQWPHLIDRVETYHKSELIIPASIDNLERVKNRLVSENTIELGRGNHWILSDNMRRFQALGISALPIIYESAQSLRIFELVARGRQDGNWSFNLCSALHVDPKQLFHLSSILVEVGLVQRFSSVAVPKRFKACTSATNASFFILSRYCSSMDPDLFDVVDPSHTTDSVTTLILALLREAGGVMLAGALRATVVLNGGFTSKQYKRGKDRLVATGRIEPTLIPKTSDVSEDDEDEKETTPKKKSYVSGFQLTTRNFATTPEKKNLLKQESFDEEVISEEEYITVVDERTTIARSLIRSNLPFREAIIFLIQNSSKITSSEIAALTGCGTKEILKALETIRPAEPRIHSEWRNEGKRKYLVYYWSENLTEETVSEPRSVVKIGTEKGYVTTATVRRAGLARTIVGTRVALSLIDLGRAIEQHEQTAGLGVPGSQVDRRTLKKICELAQISLVEKEGEAKLLIAFDSSQVSPAEAAQRVERPVGWLGTPATPPPTVHAAANLGQVSSKGRLAVLAVFGTQRVSPKKPSLRQPEVFRSKLLHSILANMSSEFFGLDEIFSEMRVGDFYKLFGSPDDPTTLSLESRIGECDERLRERLLVNYGGLAQSIAPLIKLGLVEIIKTPTRVCYTVINKMVESYWSELYLDIFVRQKNFPDFFPALKKKRAWKEIKYLSLPQRRLLEEFLLDLTSTHKGDEPLVVDSQHEGLQSVCAAAGLDASSALKELRKMTPSSKVVFAAVLEARFGCPDCGRVFYQWTSIRNHAKVEHDREVTDPSEVKQYASSRKERRRKEPSELESLRLAKRLLGETDKSKLWKLVEQIGQKNNQENTFAETKVDVSPEIQILANRILLRNETSESEQLSVWFDEMKTHGWVKKRTLTRAGRSRLFGKWAHIEAMCKRIRDPLLTEAVGMNGWTDSLFHEWTVNTDTNEDSYSSDDEEDRFVGIKKHLQLVPCASITRVVTTQNEGAENQFAQALVNMHNSGNSYVWNPAGKNAIVEEIHDSISLISELSQDAASSWTDSDRKVDAQCLADLLLHLVVLIDANPGSDIQALVGRLGLLPELEVACLLQVLTDQKMVNQENNEFFLACTT